ncbi:MAG: tRNA (adenosine(37)-N6)-threonylcarbamoyltransferase complex ATPase subunit type 1 TsaE [SAR86 cluster bacterium]|uniref:tRNA threonylcarbamoyladenosine biosynthesis protein TsaE n=1 Tax=SAR86 cluster bacterium TaxID=2030880 RepID=A0A520MUE7_9GAMM|nr:MAG: tRNA (adenosine(37)-N6)-threonylcarbamoyltransferase complex ATPase subunit type 1 TsaE [SAR86 cluster bacterium]
MRINITELSKTEMLGRVIADYLTKFQGLAIFYLDGDLGTGKTTLVREILKSLGWSGAVKSPTFSIIEEYKLNDIDIFHSDLYRLNGENDFEMLGLEINEQTKGILFIEWPEKISKFNFGNEFFLKLSIVNKQRFIEFKSTSQEFLNCINRINIKDPI